MPRIIIYTKSVIPEKFVTELAERLDSKVPDADIHIVDAKRVGYGVTWWEVVLIFIATEASKKIVGEVTEAGIEWAKSRFKGSESTRPKFISIFGPEGVPIVGKLVKPNGEITEEQQAVEPTLLQRIEDEIKQDELKTQKSKKKSPQKSSSKKSKKKARK